MPTLTRRADLGEIAITTTLLSIYLGARGTDRALGAVQALLAGGQGIARGRPGRGGRLRAA
jgi:hypothetical protein